MINIDDDYVDSQAPNANAIKNGRALLLKRKFVSLNKTADGTLIFGQCAGSGKSNYACSCDFIDANAPVFRCSCPSRQFPCKHCLGLMYALVSGETFADAALPEDVASKRNKLTARKENKKKRDTTPKKVNKSALKKKIAAQQKGLDLLEKLTHELVRTGMGNTNAKIIAQIEDQAKQLGNTYLPGAQSALLRFTKLFSDVEGKFDHQMTSGNRETIYSTAIDHLARLNSIIKRGREYLNQRAQSPDLAPETETPIAAWLGHAWHLTELRDAGLVQNDAELIQLAFNSYDDVARKELVDTGIWMNLQTGQIQKTQNFRPYRALKYVKAEDSFSKIAKVPELCIYPGDVNPRVRWDTMQPRPIQTQDLQTVRQHAATDLSKLVKTLKASMKNPLGDKQPIVAITFAQIATLADNRLVLVDGQGMRMAFTETSGFEEPESCHLLWLLPKSLLSNQVLIGRLHHDLDTQTLRMKPLSLVTATQVYRMTL